MRKLVVVFLMAVVLAASCVNEEKRPEYELYTNIIERAQEIRDIDVNYQLRPLSRKARLEAQGWGVKLEAQVLPQQDDSFMYGKVYIVEVNRLSDYQMIDVLAHEVIHLEQYATGQLVFDAAKSRQVIYNGVTYPDITKIEYSKRLWEQDAFREGKAVARLIRQQLRTEAQK